MQLRSRSGSSGDRSLPLFFVVLVALLLLPATGTAADDTLLGALARAYQTNPVLNAERARQRGTDENVPIALSGYRPRVDFGLTPEPDRRAQPHVRRRHAVGDAAGIHRAAPDQPDPVQRLQDGQPSSPGGGLRALRPRDVARRRAVRPAGRGDGVWERPRQSSARRGAARKRCVPARNDRGYAPAPAGGRRDPDRSRADGIAAQPRSRRPEQRRSKSRGQPRRLSPSHRRPAGPARADRADRPTPAADRGRGCRRRPPREPCRAELHLRCRRRAVCDQGRGKRTLPDDQRPGHVDAPGQRGPDAY